MLRIALSLLLLPGISVASSEGETKRPPNIVIILIDDLGYADVGCFGSTLYETPNIDRLAKNGMRFTNGYASCPVCSPTRAALMTGKHPARLRLTNFLKGRRSPKNSPIRTAKYADQLELKEWTIAEALKSKGYTTCHVGKWHLGNAPYFPEKQGFDVNIAGTRSGMPRAFFWPQWQNNPPLKGNFNGEYLPDRLSQEACRFIEASREKPFFLYLSHYTVHIPIQAKKEKIEKYRKKLAARPPKKGEQNNPVYAAMVESMDESVGRVMKTLERLKLSDNTIVVFTSDNGGLSVREGRNTPATINHPFRAGKGYLYEGGTRASWVVRWPGVTTPGSVSAEPMITHDLLPTVCDIVGIQPKDRKSNGTVDGVSLVSLLKDPKATLKRKALYWHYPHFANQGGRPGGSVRMGGWKLIERYEDGSLELYNLKDDIGETKNLAKTMPEKAKELLGMLKKWRKEVDANMPEPNPDYRQP